MPKLPTFGALCQRETLDCHTSHKMHVCDWPRYVVTLAPATTMPPDQSPKKISADHASITAIKEPWRVLTNVHLGLRQISRISRGLRLQLQTWSLPSVQFSSDFREMSGMAYLAMDDEDQH